MLIKIILFILAFCAFFVGIYYVIRLAVHEEVVVTMREEFEYQRENFKLVIE